jgi:Tfp pilus assembly protein PilO
MKNYKIAVLVLLALLALSAAACLFSFAYGFLQDRARQGRLEKSAAASLQKEEFRRLGAEHADWQKLPADLRQFRSRHIISMDDFAAFRRELNLCLDDNGFPAPDISYKYGRSRGRLQKVSFQFTLNGSYRNLKKFIYDMERKPKMQFFETIDLKGGNDAVSGRFTMEAYLED